VIFNLYSRVKLKLGDEEHVFDHGRLMFTEVAEIEKVTGLSYGEWERELGRFSIAAVAALLHVLRKRDEMPSDFATLQFNVADLNVVPLHDDGSEFTAAEVTADVLRRVDEAKENGGGPTSATAAAVAPESGQQATTITSLSSPSGTGSGPGSSTNGSPGVTSRSSRRTRTAS
jgi:hypothetical protein